MSTVVEELSAYMKCDLSAFAFMSPDDLGKISNFFQCKNYRSGEILWEEGGTCDYVAFIVSGRVQIKKKTKLKKNQIILGVYGKGAYIGALCILDGSPRAVTAEVMDDACIATITRDNFDRLTKEHPDLGTALVKGMLMAVSKRLKNSFSRLVAVF
jgi:CRP-like cAMP-binding protein